MSKEYMRNPFAKKLRELRVIFGISQLEVAEYLGVDRSTYSHYEEGKTTPSIVTLNALARYYSIDPLTLLEVEIPEDKEGLNYLDIFCKRIPVRQREIIKSLPDLTEQDILEIQMDIAARLKRIKKHVTG